MRRILLIGLLAFGGMAEAGDIPPADRLSGFQMMGPDVQAMQRDDFANPAMLSVRAGETLWSTAPQPGKPSCLSCHGDVAGLQGIAARYPQFDADRALPIDLAGRIQTCQTDRQGVSPAPRESAPLLALQSLIALQSRGQPLAPPGDLRLAPARAEGRALFNQRMGQLDLSCAQCHTDNWGKSLGGTRVPQAHPTGYPIFRMEWQQVGSLQRRIRNCMTGVRAEPFAPGAPEIIALELYLMERAAGMLVDAPAVRP
ncbi:L-cysteine S-thiosulfotransferase subunit SoxA [Rhabdaerophilaceae bacterium]